MATVLGQIKDLFFNKENLVANTAAAVVPPKDSSAAPVESTPVEVVTEPVENKVPAEELVVNETEKLPEEKPDDVAQELADALKEFAQKVNTATQKVLQRNSMTNDESRFPDPSINNPDIRNIPDLFRNEVDRTKKRD